jgi:hypothetical protein
MISHKIVYKDFDDNDQVETAWFHLSKKKLIEYETSTDGGMAKALTALLESNDGGKIVRTFGDIIGMAYGQRVEGNASQFLQSPEITKAFMDSPAYDALLTELLTNENTATTLIAGIFPKDLMAQLNSGNNNPQLPFPTEAHLDPESARELSGLKDPFHAGGTKLVAWAFRNPTDGEQRNMTHDQLLDCMKRRSAGWEPKPA